MTEILKLTSVGLISGLFSAFLSFRGHQHRRHWEIRVAAYQELINSLSDLHYYFSTHFELHVTHRQGSDEQNRKLNEIWDAGYTKVRQAADAGSFLFSDRVNDALNEFRNSFSTDYETNYEHLDANSFQVHECLKTVVSASKQDLALNWKLWS